MNFIENIYERLVEAGDRSVLEEARDGAIHRSSGGELARMVRAARTLIRRAGLKKGDRCALLANNSIRWAAIDLALMGEGVIVHVVDY